MKANPKGPALSIGPDCITEVTVHAHTSTCDIVSLSFRTLHNRGVPAKSTQTGRTEVFLLNSRTRDLSLAPSRLLRFVTKSSSVRALENILYRTATYSVNRPTGISARVAVPFCMYHGFNTHYRYAAWLFPRRTNLAHINLGKTMQFTRHSVVSAEPLTSCYRGTITIPSNSLTITVYTRHSVVSAEPLTFCYRGTTKGTSMLAQCTANQLAYTH